ncbi:dipeptide epimerase [Mesoterricola silvestris]|uniref:Dipeptide epimerase n=1 Tax=Mesoterricola silvestris TaxID=2927979 RepID=A0AA48K8Y7_9BACT|nr:dipeptide epimerase [Mesoterricola silvestris]BDU72846.1 muconate cycloisomerase [Mesoterricola silvestris]
MKRRELFQALAAATAGSALLGRDLLDAPPAPAAAPRAPGFTTRIRRLELRHTWTTTMSSSAYRDTLHAEFTRDGITGYGEGAGIVRYQQSALGGQQALEAVASLITGGDPWTFDKLLAELDRRLPGQRAALAAVDLALFDWMGKKLGVPVYRHFGLDPADAAVTNMSIGIDTPEITRQKVREAEDFPVLKIKVGLATDEATLEAVRSVTKKPLRVDANEGWTSKEEAARKINWLESQGVQLIEQPLPAHMVEEHRWIRNHVHIPIFADEACHSAQDIPRLRESFDGIVVKLDKAGGLLEAYRQLTVAKALGMKTMIGCMVSSSCSITAAAHLSPLADYADLDGFLLIANDPYVGVTAKKGKLILPGAPGLGVRLVR